MLNILFSPNTWIAFLTLTALELVLGIDNIIFISIVVERVPEHRRNIARLIGLFLAMFMRIGLLSILSLLIGLTAPLFIILNNEISGRDLILISGGLFLLWKSTREIHQMLEAEAEKQKETKAVSTSFFGIVIQIIVIDLIFSLDSIITAVGMVDNITVMIAAVVVSVGLMMIFAPAIGQFVGGNPTIKMLALSFLVAVGVVLIADGFGHHVPKGYIYFAMAFSVCVEILNIRVRKKHTI